MFPTRQREKNHIEANPLKIVIFPVAHGKNRMSEEVENWGSPISVPVAPQGDVNAVESH